MDLEPDSTSITVARETHQEITEDATERATETAGNGRRATTTRAATLAKERVKPVENDEKSLLPTMGKQIKELHAAKVEIVYIDNHLSPDSLAGA
ncbi:hypothetical protein CTAM01_16895 [Colletotrichum tamarilloi]|uniref:Uncharacterized protein n=1 Tax=Colletotrichum tamarilloi TaxID=1209934 RepID=A0ABQ9QH84_9PEZI|nr:uncharacterized protein CTAM01_16895 [Colletotrichum tamarilloi]KAK1470231.1 hypothetical protein CTAM01_16895 [Colletotrichum tamarilloi]